MSLIILTWLFCRIRKSIFSKQKHQLSSHFHSSFLIEHTNLWNTEIVKLFERISTHQQLHQFERYWVCYEIWKYEDFEACQVCFANQNLFQKLFLNSMLSSILNSNFQSKHTSKSSWNNLYNCFASCTLINNHIWFSLR